MIYIIIIGSLIITCWVIIAKIDKTKKEIMEKIEELKNQNKE